MKKAIVFLANGFEEMEALGTVDILRRGGIEVTTVSITADPIVIGAHNVPVIADTILDNALLNDADALILPGGMPGASNLNNSETVKKHCYNNTAKVVSWQQSVQLLWYWADSAY